MLAYIIVMNVVSEIIAFSKFVQEIHRWKKFKEGLASDEEKQAFDELMDLVRGNAMAEGNACNPILFTPMAMSILLGQQKRIRTLQRKIDALLVTTLPRSEGTS